MDILEAIFVPFSSKFVYVGHTRCTISILFLHLSCTCTWKETILLMIIPFHSIILYKVFIVCSFFYVGQTTHSYSSLQNYLPMHHFLVSISHSPEHHSQQVNILFRCFYGGEHESTLIFQINRTSPTQNYTKSGSLSRIFQQFLEELLLTKYIIMK